MFVVAISCAVLIYGGFIFLLAWFLQNRIKVKRLRDYRCIFTGKDLEIKTTRDTSYSEPDREVRYARIWAGELQIDSKTTTIKGDYVQGEQDKMLTSPSLGYKIGRTESAFYKNQPGWTLDSDDCEIAHRIRKAKIKYEIISFGKLNDKQKKTLEKVVKAAEYTL